MQNSFWKQFLDGVLTTALATPCTAPFLGSALAFAFTSSAPIILAVFIAIGLGLATPFVVFAMSPKLMSLLPKPGNWMFAFKQFLGFLLLGTVVWLLSVLHGLTGKGAIWALLLLLIVAFSLWLHSKVKDLKTPIGVLLVLACATGTAANWDKLTTIATAQVVTQSKLIAWKAYSKDLVQEATRNKQAIFIEFTADWCVTCKANENLVIETKEVADVIKARNILPLMADWTTGSDLITEALNEYGGNAVPHYVVINPTGEIEVLPPLLTKGSLVEALYKS